jgi:hypothetical protein
VDLPTLGIPTIPALSMMGTLYRRIAAVKTPNSSQGKVLFGSGDFQKK